MIDYPTFYLICAACGIHYIADFILQSREVAIKKSDCLFSLLAHVGIYSITYALLSYKLIFPLFQWDSIFIKNQIEGLFLIYLIITHFGTDYITSRLNKKLYPSKAFWNCIGADQMIHLISIFGFFTYIS